MKTLAILAGAVALFGSVVVLPISTDAAGPVAGIAGVLDPSTGTFTTRPALVQAATALQKSGTVTVTTTVVIDSAIPLDQPITCNVSISAYDSSFVNSASGENNVVRSGSSGKCTTVIHYIWEVASSSTMMSVSVSISTGSFGTDTVSHSADHSFTPFAVPSTSTSLAVTLAL
jgi:hypothetical protein